MSEIWRVVSRWRQAFQQCGADIFADQFWTRGYPLKCLRCQYVCRPAERCLAEVSGQNITQDLRALASASALTLSQIAGSDREGIGAYLVVHEPQGTLGIREERLTETLFAEQQVFRRQE